MENILQKSRALNIAEDLLDVFSAFANNIGAFCLSYPGCGYEDVDISKMSHYMIFEWHDNEKKAIQPIRCGMPEISDEKFDFESDELFKHNTYYLFYKNKQYRMNIYDSPSWSGWNTLIHYDESKYLYCEIMNYFDGTNKKYFEGANKKFKMDFGFDIVNMTFLELFEISYINKKGYVRSCQEKDIDEIESALFGRNLMSEDVKKKILDCLKET